MTDDARWIRPRDWNRTQTYKRSSPRWIKTYASRVLDDSYRALSPLERAALHGLELLYAITGTPVRLDVKSLNSKLGLRTYLATWEALNHAGFVDLMDSLTVPPEQSRAEQSKEEREAEQFRAERADSDGDPDDVF